MQYTLHSHLRSRTFYSTLILFVHHFNGLNSPGVFDLIENKDTFYVNFALRSYMSMTKAIRIVKIVPVRIT